VAAVIWTDVVQMFVYVGGAALVFTSLLARIPGGWDGFVAAAAAAGKFRVFDLSADPAAVYTLWAGLLGGVALTLATHGTDQYLVQRLLSARSAREAGAGLVLSGVIVGLQFAFFLTIGAMLFVFYEQTPLPAPLARNDEVLPSFVVHSLAGGPAGVIVAAIVAAALSPSLNAMAATTVTDFYRPYFRPQADEATLLRVSRLATVAWGVLQVAVAVLAQLLDRSLLDAGLAVLSLASGPVLGAFLLGVLNRTVGARAMLAGMAGGTALVGYVLWKGATAWTWYTFVGATATCALALLWSWAEGATRSARARTA
jgi:Na+/proline symporter